MRQIIAILCNVLFLLLCGNSVLAAQPISQKVRIQYPDETWYVVPYWGENVTISEESCGMHCKMLKLTMLSGANAKLHFKLRDLGRFFIPTSEVTIPFEQQGDKVITPLKSYRMKWIGLPMKDMIADVRYLSSEDSYFVSIEEEK